MSDKRADYEGGIPQCDHWDCEEEADVMLINIRNGSESSYCLEHAEYALDEFARYNVGEPV